MTDKDSKQPNQHRRDFLKGATGAMVAGVGASAFSGAVQAKSGHFGWGGLGKGNSQSRGFWKKVQHQFVLDKRTTYMNIGTTGSMPRHVLKNYDENNEIVAKYPWDMKDKFGDWPHTTEMVRDIAAGFGADPSEIVLSRNTTDGLCTILNGLNFQYGDVILTTHHEHVAATSPMSVVAQRYGVTVIQVQLPVFTGTESVTAEDYVSAFEDAINQAPGPVRLMMFSHITYKTGTALPAKQLCELAKSNQIPTLIDGAHTIGMLDLDLHDLDCDFYAGSGHKWQCGAGATGILYIRQNAQRVKEYWGVDNPLWFINSSLAEYDNYDMQSKLQYIGNDNYPAKQALVDSCKMWDQIGRDNIEQRVLSLGTLCKTLLKDAFPTAAIYSPDIEGLKSGITTFNPLSDVRDIERLTAFRDVLRERYGFIVRTTDFKLYKDDQYDTHALRISTHLFHSEEDVEGLVSAMKHLLYSQSF